MSAAPDGDHVPLDAPLQAKPVERGTDADDELAVERVVRGVEVKNEFPSPSDASAAAAP